MSVRLLHEQHTHTRSCDCGGVGVLKTLNSNQAASGRAMCVLLLQAALENRCCCCCFYQRLLCVCTALKLLSRDLLLSEQHSHTCFDAKCGFVIKIWFGL